MVTVTFRIFSDLWDMWAHVTREEVFMKVEKTSLKENYNLTIEAYGSRQVSMRMPSV